MFSSTIDTARDFMLRNARLLERQLFLHLFDGAPREAVLAALRAYQNLDGGFGNGLEADKRCWFSQPVDVEVAFNILDMIDAFDDPMVWRACDYLQTITTPEGGVPFAVKGVETAPRTPWWEASDPPQAAINPTGRLAGLLLKHGIHHPWLERASAFLRPAIEASTSCHFHDVIEIVPFLQYAPDRAWAEAQMEALRTRLAQSDDVALDPAAQGYAQFPIDFAPSPDHPLRGLFSQELIDLHLKALAARQQPDGGWPVTWQPVGPGAEMEWRGWATLMALRTLKAYAYA
jgi:hypothetical protein